ncbi:hypothetical protein D3C81_1588070 [compost metagenome]
MSLQVVLGQGHQLPALEHFQVHLDSAQADALGGCLGVVGAGVDHRFGTADFVRGVETVEQHLPQAQVGLGVVQGFLVVIGCAVGVGEASIGVIRLLPTVAGNQVDARVPAAFGNLDVFVCG